MLAAILRLFALRPLLTLGIFGIPVLILIAVGLFTIMALKFLIFIVLPIALVIWLFRKVFGKNTSSPPNTTSGL
jgi:hypothetical protein